MNEWLSGYKTLGKRKPPARVVVDYLLGLYSGKGGSDLTLLLSIHKSQ